jgi:hypothetical protein
MKLRSIAWCCAAFLGLVVVLGVSKPAAAADATGTWKWTVEFNGNSMERTLKLKQEGEKLTGTITGRDNTEYPIEEGKVTDGNISFKLTREFNGNKIVFTYTGKLTEDTIKGDTKIERDGDSQTRDWEAKRAK